ncbi:hypothetical protein F1D05_38050 [Kribbella qitaiheensis]|uniref:Uncharacterized protein n=1 Tax=Kribbella qitaiheensis TaxID=1544730 RepID=A0A7G6X8T1_9ACTN|nr:hypothetical protein [Kribbella qitaiheensis]QNE22646.1 hypothetical protein F1D05_38050 [Kribbella qitaiheensis]
MSLTARRVRVRGAGSPISSKSEHGHQMRYDASVQRTVRFELGEAMTAGAVPALAAERRAPGTARSGTAWSGTAPTRTAALGDVPCLPRPVAEQPNYGVAIAQLANARQHDAIRLYGRNSNVAIYTGVQQIHADNASPREVFKAVAKRLDAIGDEVRRQYEEKVL